MIVLFMMLATRAPDTTIISAALQREVAALQHPQMRWGDIADVREAVTQRYLLGSWRPLWTIDGKVTWAARGILRELDSAATRGLDPADYDARTLEARSDSLGTQGADGTAEFDVMMSVAAARYGLALSHGRIDPHLLHPAVGLVPDSVDLVEFLDQLRRSTRPDTLFRNLEPHHATYQRLIGLLAHYRVMASATALEPPDSIPTRVRQLGLALERWRWLPHSAVAPWVLVNVPAFELYAHASDREDEGTELRMSVVAGRATTHPTPLLVTKMVAVQFHPPWLVPQAIAVREIRPVALRDSTYLRRQHFELLRGDSVVPASRNNVLGIGGAIDVRQTPGPWNALGSIKFVTPNGASVFLHDTPERQDFGLARRDLSHGCIRVVAPVTLAEFALQGLPEWTSDRIAEALADTATLEVPLPKAIPVFVIYQTLVPRKSGGMIVYPDVYGFDRRLELLLRDGYPFRTSPIP
jgi:murein L,D-transpeptidase YcbB/YkuD